MSVERRRFYGRMVLLRAGRDLYLLLYVGLAGGFGWLDRHQLRRARFTQEEPR